MLAVQLSYRLKRFRWRGTTQGETILLYGCPSAGARLRDPPGLGDNVEWKMWRIRVHHEEGKLRDAKDYC